MRNIWFKLQSWKFNGKDLVHWHMAFGKNVDTLFAFSEGNQVELSELNGKWSFESVYDYVWH